MPYYLLVFLLCVVFMVLCFYASLLHSEFLFLGQYRSKVSIRCVHTQSFVFFFSSWTVVTEALDQQLETSLGVLQVWEVYSELAESFSQRLETLQSDTTSALNGAAQRDDTAEQVAVKIHNVEVRM